MENNAIARNLELPRRAGADAPLGNMNAVKHGERSRRAFFPLAGGDQLPPLVGLLAEHIGA